MVLLAERRFSTRTGWLNCHVRYCSNHPMLAAHFQVHAPNRRAQFFWSMQTDPDPRFRRCHRHAEEGVGGEGEEAVSRRCLWKRGEDIVVPFDDGLLQILRREIC